MTVHADNAERRRDDPRTRPESAAQSAELGAPRAGGRSGARSALEALLNESPRVAQLTGIARTINSAQADGGGRAPIQRVVRWNGMRYDAAAAGRLRRLLERSGFAADLVATMVEHARRPGTYTYEGLNPVLRNAAQQDAPRLDAPQQEAPQQDAPQLGAPQVDAPPQEAPHLDAPQQIAPQQELPQPVALDPGLTPPVARAAPNEAVYPDDAARSADYVRDYNARTQTVGGLANADLNVGDRLYHATSRDSALLIAASGLQPKRSEWGAPSASKDGYLSMAVSAAGADAMGARGRTVLLRITLTANDIVAGKWKRASGTEVLTTETFLPGRLRWRWKVLRQGEANRWRTMDAYTQDVARTGRVEGE